MAPYGYESTESLLTEWKEEQSVLAGQKIKVSFRKETERESLGVFIDAMWYLVCDAGRVRTGLCGLAEPKEKSH